MYIHIIGIAKILFCVAVNESDTLYALKSPQYLVLAFLSGKLVCPEFIFGKDWYSCTAVFLGQPSFQQ